MMNKIIWSAPKITENLSCSDMPGDKVSLCPEVEYNAQVVFPKLLGLLTNQSRRIVISICGGSGSGKSGMASLISYYFKEMGIQCYTLSGDNYPRRIPKYNDAERVSIYRYGGIQSLLNNREYSNQRFEVLKQLQSQDKDADTTLFTTYPWMATYFQGGREALKGYLGTPNEINFNELNHIITEFKQGTDKLWFKRMGREVTDLWYDEITFEPSAVLLIEWTHGNSDYIEGIDIPIFLNSTPQETLEGRKKRNRDQGTDSPFVMMVLSIEQELLEQQAQKAKIILSRQGELLTYEQYQAIMKAAKEETNEKKY